MHVLERSQFQVHTVYLHGLCEIEHNVRNLQQLLCTLTYAFFTGDFLHSEIEWNESGSSLHCHPKPKAHTIGYNKTLHFRKNDCNDADGQFHMMLFPLENGHILPSLTTVPIL